MIKINNKQELDQFIGNAGDEVAVVKFGAPWCGPCRVLEQNIEQVGDIAKFAEVDVDEADEDFITSERIMNVPVIRYYYKGELVDRHVGLETKQGLQDAVAKIKHAK